MEKKQLNWKPITRDDPKEHVRVMTKIDDELGVRNEAILWRQGRLWFESSGTMYVYYTPTHYAEIESTGGQR